MKVTKLPACWVRFDTIAVASVFQCDSNVAGAVYMKMRNTTGCDYNAVNIATGEPVSFGCFEKVKPMNGSFVETVSG